MENRRPRLEVAAVTLHNTHNDQGEWIPDRYVHQPGFSDRYVNRRQEGANTVAQVLPPWTFEIVLVTR